MARVNVYLPDDLARRARTEQISISAVTQNALRAALASVDTDSWLDNLENLNPAVSHTQVIAALSEAREEFGA